MTAKQYDTAIASFLRASVLGPTQHVVWVQLGEAYSALAKTKDPAEQPQIYQQAIDAYNHALSLLPDDPNYRNNYGLVLAAAGKVPEASAAFQQAAKLDPAKASMYLLNLGVVLRGANQNREAIEAVRSIQKQDPQYAAASWLTSVATVAVYLDSASRNFQDLKGKQVITDADVRKIAAEAEQPAGNIDPFTSWDASLVVPGGSCSVSEHPASSPHYTLECGFDDGSSVQELKSSYDTLISMVSEAIGSQSANWQAGEVPKPSGLDHLFQRGSIDVWVEIYAKAASQPTVYRADLSVDVKQIEKYFDQDLSCPYRQHTGHRSCHLFHGSFRELRINRQ